MELNLTIPRVSGDMQKDVKELRNYIFQLTEQLRYALYNLDVTDFNNLGLARYENGKLQIYSDMLQASVRELELKISGEEESLRSTITAKAGELTALFENEKTGLRAEYTAAVDGLSATITEKLNSVDTKVSMWQQTVDGFSSTVSKKLSEVDTKVSAWQQTVDGFSQTVTEKLNGVDVKVSTWQQTVDGFSQTVTEKLNGVDVKVSTWQQTVDGFSQQISDRFTTLEGTYVTSSTFRQTSDTVESMVQQIGTDGSILQTKILQTIEDDESLIKLIAENVEVEGVLTISDMEDALVDGETVISGDNILTGTIRASNFVASGDIDETGSYAISIEDGYENTIGWIGYQIADEGGKEHAYGVFADKLWLRTDAYEAGSIFYPSIKLSAAGRISVEALGHEESAVYIAAPYYISLDVYHGNSDGFVMIRDNEGYEWEFRDGHLYRDGDKML